MMNIGNQFTIIATKSNWVDETINNHRWTLASRLGKCIKHLRGLGLVHGMAQTIFLAWSVELSRALGYVTSQLTWPNKNYNNYILKNIKKK